MKYAPEILKLVEAGLKEDSTKVLNYCNFLIDKMGKNGDKKTAERLIKIIKSNRTTYLKEANHPIFKLKSPVDHESRLPLAEIKQYSEESIFLSIHPNIRDDIEEFITLINHSNILNERGIRTNRNLLIYGPPGTGKTQAARYISAKIKLPLVTVRIDGLVSSYLGSTSKNIRTLFDFVRKTPCILFLDEFDAIAKMRNDSNELGELKRVVNALLQNIDSIQGDVPIIAATNHQHLLDSAIWRRFDYKIKMDLPDSNERKTMLKEFLNNLMHKENNILILSSMTKDMSGADIEIFCDMIKTNLILNKNSKFDEKLLFRLFIKYTERSGKEKYRNLRNTENQILLLKSFRNDDKKTFNIRTLSQMLDISAGKTSNLFREDIKV